MKNHQSNPTGSKPFLKVNETFVQKTRKNRGYRYRKNKWKMRRDNPLRGNPSYHKKWRHNEPNQEKVRILINLKISVIGVVCMVIDLALAERQNILQIYMKPI